VCSVHPLAISRPGARKIAHGSEDALPDHHPAGDRLRAPRAAKGVPEQRLAIGLGKAPEDVLVLPKSGGEPLDPNGVTREWTRRVATLKLPRVSLHSLRHTHASQLIASGLDVLTISRRLEHGSPTITLAVYGHLFANTDDRAAQVMEGAFGAALTE